MARVSIAFDQEHNPTQLAAELRAAGLDASVSDQQTNRFWVNVDGAYDLDTINQVVADHVPSITGNLTGDVTGDVTGNLTNDITLLNGLKIVGLTTAVTANVTTTTAPAGSMGITSHATGRGKLFMSDGAKWQFAAVA